MTAEALADDPTLANIKGVVRAYGERQWTVEEALELGVSVPVIRLLLWFATPQQAGIWCQIGH